MIPPLDRKVKGFLKLKKGFYWRENNDQVIITFECVNNLWELFAERTHFNQVTFGPNDVDGAQIDEFFRELISFFATK
jgi:hypothetical protein